MTNRTQIWIRSIIRTVAVLALVTIVGAAEAGETISVTLQSGRKFTAEVHVRSNAQRLWLRFGQEGTSLLRPVAWEQVAFAMHGNQKLTAEELKAQVATLSQPRIEPEVQSPTTSITSNGPTTAERAALALRDE